MRHIQEGKPMFTSARNEFKTEESFRKWFEDASVLAKYGIRKILVSQSYFPDLILETSSGSVIVAEVELRTSNFDAHNHDEEQVDLVIVWLHDEPYRKRRFKVLDASIRLANGNPLTVDEVLGSEKDLVFDRLRNLPLIASRSTDGEKFRLIQRYRKAWRTINQKDVKYFFQANLDELVEEFKRSTEVNKKQFLGRQESYREWFPNKVFHRSLCLMAKAIIFRGTLQLVEEGIIPVRPTGNRVLDIYAMSKGKLNEFRKLVQRQRLAYQLGTYPFASYEMKSGFHTDYMDAFIHNFNFKAGASFPVIEIPLRLQEITVWKEFGEKYLSEEEAFEKFGLKKPELNGVVFNPMKREFSPSQVVHFSWKLASGLRRFGFIMPDDAEKVIKKLYDLIVHPIGVITNANKMPSIEGIKFFFYPQNRIGDVLRRFETTKGLSRKHGVRALKRFYQNYPLF